MVEKPHLAHRLLLRVMHPVNLPRLLVHRHPLRPALPNCVGHQFRLSRAKAASSSVSIVLLRIFRARTGPSGVSRSDTEHNSTSSGHFPSRLTISRTALTVKNTVRSMSEPLEGDRQPLALLICQLGHRDASARPLLPTLLGGRGGPPPPPKEEGARPP